MSGDSSQIEKFHRRFAKWKVFSLCPFSTFLYLAFAVVLGATCTRDVLQNDYMIAEKVSTL